MNLYPIIKSGYYIYKIKNDRYFAQRRFIDRKRKSALFYSLEDAVSWIDTL